MWSLFWHNPEHPDVHEWFREEEVEKWFYYSINWSISTLGHKIRLETRFVTRNHFLHFLSKLISFSIHSTAAPKHHWTGSNPLQYDRKQKRVRRCQHPNLKYKLQRPLGCCRASRWMEGWTAGHQWHKYFLYFMNSGHTHHTLTIIVPTTLSLHCSGQGWWGRRDDVPPSSTTEEPNNNHYHHPHHHHPANYERSTTTPISSWVGGCARETTIPQSPSPSLVWKWIIYVAHKSLRRLHIHTECEFRGGHGPLAVGRSVC